MQINNRRSKKMREARGASLKSCRITSNPCSRPTFIMSLHRLGTMHMTSTALCRWERKQITGQLPPGTAGVPTLSSTPESGSLLPTPQGVDGASRWRTDPSQGRAPPGQAALGDTGDRRGIKRGAWGAQGGPVAGGEGGGGVVGGWMKVPLILTCPG